MDVKFYDDVKRKWFIDYFSSYNISTEKISAYVIADRIFDVIAENDLLLLSAYTRCPLPLFAGFSDSSLYVLSRKLKKTDLLEVRLLDDGLLSVKAERLGIDCVV